MKKVLLLLGFAFLLTACGMISPGRNIVPGPMMNPGSGWWGNTRFDSNGEQIYFTATNDQGDRIPYSGGPASGGMMMGGGYLNCASCHGSDGRGGVHTMHMDVMDAPDIRFSTLSNESGGHGEEETPHADEHTGYDLENFRQAVIEGNHPNGDTLNRGMPRWELNDDDLTDLFEFLKSLP